MEPRASLLGLAQLSLHLSEVETHRTVVESLKRSPLVLNTSSDKLLSVFYFLPERIYFLSLILL